MCLLYDGSTRRLTESGFMWFYGFMEKPGIEPATPGLQGIVFVPRREWIVSLFSDYIYSNLLNFLNYIFR